MKSKIHTYTSDDIAISYDVARCIHAAECVRGNARVFNPKRKPWIDPEAAPADTIAEVIQRCPTGALHFERHDGEAEETAPAKNTVAVEPKGPLYVRGDLELAGADGSTVLLKDTRMALCRCGASANKPLCDGSHTKAGFEDAGTLGPTGLEPGPGQATEGSLRVLPLDNGPLVFKGPLDVIGADDACVHGQKVSLCRCGGSQKKPFCDGTHRAIGFTTG